MKGIKGLLVGLASGLGVASGQALALDLGNVVRPIDATLFPQQEELTLRQVKTVEGTMELGRALLSIGRTDLLGLEVNLDSFSASSLETPLGGNFGNGVLEDHGFETQKSQIRRQNQRQQTRQTTRRVY